MLRRALVRLQTLLVVVLVIAALVGVSVPYFQDNLSESQRTKAKQDLEVMKKATQLFAAREGRLPRQLDELLGRYMQALPRDPWGNDYGFDPQTGALFSLGADALEEGSGGDTDVFVYTQLQAAQVASSWMGRLQGASLGRLGLPALTFGLEADDGSFTRARAMLEQGRAPPASTLRSEEFVNALDYQDPPPAPGAGLFRLKVEGARLGGDRALLRVSARARRGGRERPPLHLVAAVDTSGSMDRPGRRDLVAHALRRLAEALGPRDRVAVVTFAGEARLALAPTVPGHALRLRGALRGASFGGATDTDAGLRLAFRVATGMRAPGATTRVLLFSDGLTTRGPRDADALVARARSERQGGIYLDTFGVGLDGDDPTLDRLADAGDGQAAFLDHPSTAARLLVDQLERRLVTVAREARAQVVLDPRAVRAARLVGFEGRRMSAGSFRDDAADAGELGAGHGCSALVRLELVPGGPEVLGELRVRAQPAEGGPAQELARPLTRADLARSLGEAPRGLRLARVAARLCEALAGEDRQPRSLRREAGRLARAAAGDPQAAALAAMVARADALGLLAPPVADGALP